MAAVLGATRPHNAHDKLDSPWAVVNHTTLTTSAITPPDVAADMKLRTPDAHRPHLSPSASSPSRHPPHPLSQPPITAATAADPTSATPTPSALHSPLPMVPLAPPAVKAIRQSLHRRRSSFPPAVGSAVAGANEFPWVMGGTPPASRVASLGFHHDLSGTFGLEIGSGYGSGLTPMSGAWESLLNFDGDDSISAKVVRSFAHVATDKADDAKSSPGSPARTAITPSKKALLAPALERTVSGSDVAWRTILARTVEIEGVGSVGIARILSEVWKRGGPNVVTSQSLWPSILMSLSLSPDLGTGERVGTPSAQASLALQALYNVAIRPNEAYIFAGFLSSYLASSAPAANAFQAEAQVYGPWTPTKLPGEPDITQWTTFTPGEEWPSLGTTLPSGSGLTPRREFSPALPLPPIQISDPMDLARPDSRSQADGISGIDELLAEMEEGTIMREAERTLMDSSWTQTDLVDEPQDHDENSMNLDVFVSPKRNSTSSEESPVEHMVDVSMVSSPFVSGASLLSATSASTSIPSVLPPPTERTNPQPQNGRHRPPPPLQLSLPNNSFIPPPPMCMFFSPTFRDLQKGKVAVWKGDLVVRGRGGGTFNVLVIGEEGSDQFWQSHTWSESLVYPPAPVVTESYTATMIPVSTLAREGLLPVTMGMVLCNDENINDFVRMVQGLHAEGVAFHLPLPGHSLPIVFLPAKFDSVDPLQRLGIAFMTKGGVPLAQANRSSSSRTNSTHSEGSEAAAPAPERKRRRKSSATDTTAPKPGARRRNVAVRPKTS